MSQTAYRDATGRAGIGTTIGSPHIVSQTTEQSSANGRSHGSAMNLPNQLTLARVVMVPIFVGLLSVHHWVSYAIGYLVFTAAAITDYYDGKIARSRNIVTNFGKLLDPVADKVLLAAGFVMMMVLPSASEPAAPALHIPGWTVVAILAREFVVTGVRSLSASEGVVIAANNYGKAKAVIQMVYVFVFLFFAVVEHGVVVYAPMSASEYHRLLFAISYWAIVVVATYTVYSGAQFLRANWKQLHLGSSS